MTHNTVYLDEETNEIIKNLKIENPEFNLSKMVRNFLFIEYKRDKNLEKLRTKRLEVQKKRDDLERELSLINKEISHLEDLERSKQDEMLEEQQKIKLLEKEHFETFMFFLKEEGLLYTEKEAKILFDRWKNTPKSERPAIPIFVSSLSSQFTEAE